MSPSPIDAMEESDPALQWDVVVSAAANAAVGVGTATTIPNALAPPTIPVNNDIPDSTDNNHAEHAEETTITATGTEHSFPKLAPPALPTLTPPGITLPFPDALIADTLTNSNKRPSKPLMELAKKRRRKNTPRKERKEFTDQEKLDILNELRKGESTQASICRNHGASISSIKRWKAEEDKIKARVAPKKERKEFTHEEKLAILDEIKKGNATQAAICRKHGASTSSVKRWKQNAEKIRAYLKCDTGIKTTKRIYSSDGLRRIKDALKVFYDLNEAMPRDLKVPLTREFVCSFTVSNQK